MNRIKRALRTWLLSGEGPVEGTRAGQMPMVPTPGAFHVGTAGRSTVQFSGKHLETLRISGGHLEKIRSGDKRAGAGLI